MKSFKEVERIDHICETCDLYEDLEITEAEYQGKTVKLNDPIRTSENPPRRGPHRCSGWRRQFDGRSGTSGDEHA